MNSVKRTGLVAALLLGCVTAATPATTNAAVTFGADLSKTPDSATSFDSVTTVIDPDGSADTGAPVSGILTSVRVKTSGPAANGVVRILSLTDQPNFATYDFLNDGPEVPFSTPATSPAGQITQVLTRRPITAGEHLGLYTAGSLVNDENGDLTAICAYTTGSTSGPGTTTPYYALCMTGVVVLVSGTIEPDADHDGFGDETQDQCPTNGTTQGPCSPPVKKKCTQKKKHKSDAQSAKKKCKKKH